MRSGIIKSFRKNHHDDVDGLVLDDGTEVHFPPHVGHQVVASIKVGDQVTVEGKMKNRPHGESVFDASEIQGASGTIKIKPPKPGGKHHKHARSSDSVNATGRVLEFHYNRHGELDGFRLDDGWEVKYPPHLANNLLACVSLGDVVLVEGHRHETPKGDLHLHAKNIVNQRTNDLIQHDDEPREDVADTDTLALPSNADIMLELNEIKSLLQQLLKSQRKPRTKPGPSPR